MDPTYPIFPVFSFIAFILVLIPLPWHFQAWNSGTCLYMLWTAVGCLNLFINSIVWHNNAIDKAPLWCDISTRIVVGVSVAIPAASLCINRRLYKIASCQTANMTRAHKFRAVMVDLAIGLGIPVLQMPLQFIVQGHRYDIWEDVGCYPTTVNTPAAYPLTFLWPNIIGLVSAVYCILTLRAFMKRRAEFSQFLSCNSALTANRYFRLMALATIEVVFNLPLSTYGLYFNIKSRPMYPWVSWSNTHFEFFIINTFPAVEWRMNPAAVVNLELSRWAIIFCAFLFFGFFGFAEESRKNYRAVYWVIAKRFGILPPALPVSGSKTSSDLKKYSQSSSLQTQRTTPVSVPRPLQLVSSKSDSASCRKSCVPSEYTASVDQMSLFPDHKLDTSLTSSTPPSSPLSRTSCDTYTAIGSPVTDVGHESEIPSHK